MLKIRLQRVGRTKVATFRVVVTESENSSKSGKFLEIVGFHDPVHDIRKLDVERIKYWISKGATPTETLHNLFISEKIIEGKKVNVLSHRFPKKPDAPAQAVGEGKVVPATEPSAEAPVISEPAPTTPVETAPVGV